MHAKMSEDASRRLVIASGLVADRVNGGENPDSAIAKVAAETGLASGHAQLLVNAYNIGATTRQRCDGETPTEKAADFKLASMSKVHELLYPSQVKSAATHYRDHGVSPEYSSPPTWVARRDARNAVAGVMTKLAAETPVEPSRAAASPSLYAQAAQHDMRLRLLDEVSRQIDVTRDRVITKLASLGDYFASNGNLAPCDVEPVIDSLYGDRGRAVLSRALSSRPSLTKRAAVAPHHAISEHPTPYDLVSGILEDANTLSAAERIREKTAATVEAADPFASIATPASVLDSPEPPSMSGSPYWAIARDLCSEPKLAGFADDVKRSFGYSIGGNAISRAASELKPATYDTTVDKLLNRIATPEHESRLAAIEAGAHLHDMMNNDAVIRGHDPFEVAEHYNRLSQFAPSLSRKPLMTTPLIRKSIEQGHLDAFDAGTAAAAEHKLRETDGKPRPQHFNIGGKDKPKQPAWLGHKSEPKKNESEKKSAEGGLDGIRSVLD